MCVSRDAKHLARKSPLRPRELAVRARNGLGGAEAGVAQALADAMQRAVLALEAGRWLSMTITWLLGVCEPGAMLPPWLCRRV